MNIERFTVKSREAIERAQRIAQDRSIRNCSPAPARGAPAGRRRHDAGRARQARSPARHARIRERRGAVAPRAMPQGRAGVSRRGVARRARPRGDAGRAAEGRFVSVEHLLLAMTDGAQPDGAQRVLARGRDRGGALKALAGVRGGQRVTDDNPEDKYQALSNYGRDLTAAARSGKLDPVIPGATTRSRRVVQVRIAPHEEQPVLIGEPGVGKTAIVEGLAQRIVSGDVPGNRLPDKRVIALDLGALSRAASSAVSSRTGSRPCSRKSRPPRTASCCSSTSSTPRRRRKAEGAMDASNLLKPRSLRAASFTTSARPRSTSTASTSRRTPRSSAASSPSSWASRASRTRSRSCAVSGALRSPPRHPDPGRRAGGRATLSNRYIPDRKLPDKAIDLIDEASSRLKMEIDSMPVELDEISRKVRQLEIERIGLAKETDGASRAPAAARQGARRLKGRA